MAYIAGPYVWTYGGAALGSMEQTPILEWVPSQESIVSDQYGDTIIDGIYRGGNMYMTLVLNEYNAAGALAAFHPQSATLGAVGTPGVLMSTFSAALVGTAIAGTNASTNPATWTATGAVLAPGNNIQLLFGTRKRNVPIRFILFPFSSGGNQVFFTTT